MIEPLTHQRCRTVDGLCNLHDRVLGCLEDYVVSLDPIKRGVKIGK